MVRQVPPASDMHEPGRDWRAFLWTFLSGDNHKPYQAVGRTKFQGQGGEEVF